MKDVDLWLNLLLPQKQFSKPITSAAGTYPKGLCFNFNEGQCKLPNNCRYKHKCAHCAGPHPAVRCFKKLGSHSNSTSKDLFRNIGNTGEIGKHVAMASSISRSQDSGHAN